MRNHEHTTPFQSDSNNESSCKKHNAPSFDSTNSRYSGFSPSNHKVLLSQLECFVAEVLLNDELPFVHFQGNDGPIGYTPTPLAIKYFESVPDFIDVVSRLSPRYEYSEPVNIFVACCSSMGLLGKYFDWRHPSKDPNQTYPGFGNVSAVELFNTLVQALRREWKINNLQAKVNARKQEVSAMRDDYCDYADSLFSDCARLVLVRVDLFYDKKYSDSIDAFEMTKDLDRLFGNSRHNALFACMKGYIVKLEYGVDKGLHCHALFFFDGSKRKNSSHVHLAKEIGDYWKNRITKGRGDYWNVNAYAGRYDALGRRGIGVINWDQAGLRQNLKEFVVSYLCKEDQYFRPKGSPKVRLLRRGEFPEIRVEKRGRPRKEVESYTGLSQFPQKFMPINPCDTAP